MGARQSWARCLSSPGNGAAKLSLCCFSPPASYPRKTRPWKSKRLCCLLQPTTAPKAVQIVFPLLTISDREHIFLGAFLTFGIFSCSLAIVFASSLFSYRESRNDLQLKSFFNSFLLLLWQNRFWTVGTVQRHLLAPQIVLPFYQEILLSLDLISCLCKRDTSGVLNKTGEICTSCKFSLLSQRKNWLMLGQILSVLLVCLFLHFAGSTHDSRW